MAGHFAAVDHAGRLAEAGWQKFPTLMHAAWAAQWLDYESRLAARLARPAVTLRVFHDEVRCSIRSRVRVRDRVGVRITVSLGLRARERVRVQTD